MKHNYFSEIPSAPGKLQLDVVDLLANVSHEIRNPLNAIIGLSNLLKVTDSEEERQEYLNGLVQTSENLLETVNNLLDFSKLKSGRLSFHLAPYNLKNALVSSLYGQKVVAQSKSLHFDVRIDERIPDLLFLDGVKLNQVVINLVSNAVKFTEKGSVEVIVEQLARGEENVKLKFSVVDTGRGISREKHLRVFKAFEQGGEEVNTQYGGTGLGLTISKRLIEAMGGELALCSEEGKGSTFSFELEFEETRQQESGKELQDVEMPRVGSRILVVDDSALNRKVISKYLEQWQLQVAEATNGAEALEELTRGTFDLLIMDLRMPVMNGYETIREIRHRSEYQALPVIALTGSLGAFEQKELRESGFTDFLLKPFRPEELLEMLKLLL